MPSLIARLLVALLLFYGTGAALAARVAPPQTRTFFENANFTDPKLSPDGRYVAARTAKPGERYRLTVFKLEDLSAKVVAHVGRGGGGNFDWSNGERLVFDTADKHRTRSEDPEPPGVYAINRE